MLRIDVTYGCYRYGETGRNIPERRGNDPAERLKVNQRLPAKKSLCRKSFLF
jgi:hypothetical protein